MATIQVIVPQGVVGGQQISVQAPEGEILQVVVPPGLVAGNPFSIQVPAPAAPAAPAAGKSVEPVPSELTMGTPLYDAVSDPGVPVATPAPVAPVPVVASATPVAVVAHVEPIPVVTQPVAPVPAVAQPQPFTVQSVPVIAQPAAPQTVLVRNWPRYSTRVTCPSCGYTGNSNVTTEMGVGTWAAAGALCFFGCWPCVCVPCCIDDLKDAHHHCRECGTVSPMFLGLSDP